MKKKSKFNSIVELIKDTFKGFSEDNVTRLSGALAYYTVFSLGPLFVVIISLSGMFLEREAVEGKVYQVLQDFVGHDTAVQLEEIIKNAGIGDKGIFAFIIGIVVLLIGATTVFSVMQGSINDIWGIKPKPKNSIVKMLKDRFLSFSVIISLGFLLLVSLAVTGLVESLSGNLQDSFPTINIVLIYIINLVLNLGFSVLIFATIFKVLPDAEIKWKDVFMGAFITALLFLIGKFGISLYVSKTDVGSTYGAAGSLVILLVWVYYSSIILYLGAEFTKAYAVKYGSEIRPSEYAVTIKEVVQETGNKSIQENEGKDPEPEDF